MKPGEQSACPEDFSPLFPYSTAIAYKGLVMSNMKHILVAVSGMTPQIITETVWALIEERGVQLSEIHVITTLQGKRRLMDALLTPQTGQFWKLCTDYGIDSSAIRFGEDTVHVITDIEGHELDDIRTSKESESARDRIFEVVEDLVCEENTCLHGSIAGGRKSMGFLLGSAIHLLGRAQDRLYHVLVDPVQVENSASFYFPTLKPEPVMIKNRTTGKEEPLVVEGQVITSDQPKIDLADIPVCRLREVVRFVSPGQYGEDTLVLTQEAVDHYAEKLQNDYEQATRSEAPFPEIIGQSDAIMRVKEDIRIFGTRDNYKVLLVGATGSGKELVSKALHKISSRSDKPFESVNCAYLRPELAISQLFGHEKGAFTGADSQSVGLFERANGGTLFLDEINSLPPEVQAMLLRVMEDGKVERMGGKEAVNVDVRLIAATNEDTDKLVATGILRDDLLQRFDAIIELPTLKERQGDIPLLAHRFLRVFNEEYNTQLVLDLEAIQVLGVQDWPGNIRQLKNAVRELCARADAAGIRVITRSMVEAVLNIKGASPSTGSDLQAQKGELESKQIRAALEQTKGNKTQAAKLLGISRSQVSRKAKAYGI